jgi:E1A/CREB-binding protein
MDLRTIGAKLDQGKYRNPWQFVDDMYLMFENALSYNKKDSIPHKCSTKLKEKFQEEINPIMSKMGYCCGQKHIFTSLSLLCYGGGLCLIAKDQEYHRYEVASSAAQYGLTSYTDTEKYIYCVKCFNNLPDEGINLSEPTGNPK